MNGILGVALQGMQNDAARMERISLNMANALTTAYKREVVIEHTFGEMIQSDLNHDAQVSPLEVSTDNHQGTFKVTGQSFDFAISGNGYFEIATPQGPAYTRLGNFRVDPQGRLVNGQGFPVMGKSGEILIRTSKPNVDLSGKFSEETDALDSGKISGTSNGQFKLMEFERAADLIKIGDGMLVASEGSFGVESKKSQIQQGQLENSNVNSMQEMVQVMQTMRHFESMQRIAQGYDEMIGTAVRKLGEVS
ncbi:flagellar hook-basal body protein [Undibacterium sp. Ji49W]|uniref:flagellar hook-basal body protein n=1 Tax=Undibacterium sp. Ji49W TaxID=3413040 RepID=UPI003BF30698